MQGGRGFRVVKRESIKKSTLKATKICDENGLPDRGVFGKLRET